LEWDVSQYNGTSTLLYTAISKPALAHMSRRGGNPLGLTEDDGPLIIISVMPQWTDPTQDEEILAKTEAFVSESVKLAEEKGIASHYIYLNYADKRQEVFKGYGEANLQRLREVSMKHDPEKVFQKLVPGGHKIW
jgi:dihydropteroate synthase